MERAQAAAGHDGAQCQTQADAGMGGCVAQKPLCKLKRQLAAWKRVQTTTILLADGQHKIATCTAQLARTAGARDDLKEIDGGAASVAKRSCTISPANIRTQTAIAFARAQPNKVGESTADSSEPAALSPSPPRPPRRPTPSPRPKPRSRRALDGAGTEQVSGMTASKRYDDSKLVLGGQQPRLHTQVPLAWRLY